jgi:type IV pilus assembly protein PilO
MATQSNLQIRGFKPQPVATRQMYAEWPIGLELDGTYHNLGSFLERVSKFPRIINITGIHIKGKDDGGPTETISAECTATTFVLVEPKKPVESAPARGKTAPAARPAAAKAG